MNEKIKFEFMREIEKKAVVMSIIALPNVISFSDIKKEFEKQEIEINNDDLYKILDELRDLNYLNQRVMNFEPQSWDLTDDGNIFFIQIIDFLCLTSMSSVNKTKWLVNAKKTAKFVKNYHNIRI
ncbi:hypothetical protein [uncultured archaeal virus]|uniref:Uncharacterized protein n=1 Tax=uncultured archaeal virus TaxID=1960247 RepID=A0A8B0LS81_9VIRU|nr:hypothetical protein [uncultured archaeal virus]